jgi:hypothetical protein
MNKADLYTAISNAFYHLSTVDHSLYDYWVDKLYTIEQDFNHSMWTEDTLRQMENDVMYQFIGHA